MNKTATLEKKVVMEPMAKYLQKMKIEDDKIKSKKSNIQEEIDDHKSTRGLEDHREEFSD